MDLSHRSHGTEDQHDVGEQCRLAERLRSWGIKLYPETNAGDARRETLRPTKRPSEKGEPSEKGKMQTLRADNTFARLRLLRCELFNQQGHLAFSGKL